MALVGGAIPSTPMSANPAPRKIDRERRARIVDGALAVVGEHGVEGLTHRRIAAAADVPLAATTYYFDSLEDLLGAAMEHLVDRDLAELTTIFDALPMSASLVEPLADLLVDSTGTLRSGTLVVTELYTAAIRRPRLREVALQWETAWAALLEPRIGPDRARVTAAGLGGLIQYALLRDEPITREQARAWVRLLLGT